MTINATLTDNLARLNISGRFDASAYQDFKLAYAPLLSNAAIKTIEVDLCGVEYLDSGALGMLVQLNEVAKNARKSVVLISMPGRASDILKVANADKLFTINLPSGMKMELNKK